MQTTSAIDRAGIGHDEDVSVWRKGDTRIMESDVRIRPASLDQCEINFEFFRFSARSWDRPDLLEDIIREPNSPRRRVCADCGGRYRNRRICVDGGKNGPSRSIAVHKVNKRVPVNHSDFRAV